MLHPVNRSIEELVATAKEIVPGGRHNPKPEEAIG